MLKYGFKPDLNRDLCSCGALGRADASEFLCIAASSGLLGPSLRATGQGSAQRAVDARANTGCAWPAWLNSDLDERARAAVKPVGVQSRRGLRPLGEKGFKTLSTSIDDAGAHLSVSVLLGPWVLAAGPSVRVRLVSSLLLVGATPFLLHLIRGSLSIPVAGSGTCSVVAMEVARKMQKKP